MDTKIIYFVHGTTYDNATKKCSGWKQVDGMDKNLIIYEEHIKEPFKGGESLEDVEKRIRDFLKWINENYSGKTVGIMAHRAPQLAIEVITKGITWEEANLNDWRKSGDWQPGWEYILKDNVL